MNPERYQQVKRVFLAACDLEPCRAAAYLDEACAADPELRQEVESLLRHHLDRGGVDRPAGEELRDAGAAGGPFADVLSNRRDGGEPERFPPGTMLAGRYRILGRLGRGGMGEVYRADDLKLGQSVALKFLPRQRVENPTWLAMYRNEVRMARKVTHVNVLRVYDLCEVEGEVFISMEYVDGEDLAALLRRVGRLTGEKVLEIARQLCAGLAAAHDRGVLHRDLKPANVMIDSRGQVRIADFGIASLTAETNTTSRLAGTPGYMAPELFGGGEASAGSDLFALGAILFEAITGGPAPRAGSSKAVDRDGAMLRQMGIAPDVDPVLEAAILGCLQTDPKRRPESAHAIAASLPGGDPLAEAIAAGQTPSPSLLAVAGGRRTIRGPVAIRCLAISLVALLVVVGLADRAFLLPQAGLDKPPAVLADKAEQMIAMLGNEPVSQERWAGFAVDRGYLRRVMPAAGRDRRWEDLSQVRPPPVFFWYRAGSKQLALPTLLNEPLPMRSLSSGGGAITVRLDGRGRLVEYRAAPAAASSEAAAAAPTNWTPVFELADLRLADFKALRPERAPPMYVDTVMAWEGVNPDLPRMPVRVEGGTFAGRVVYFKVAPAGREGENYGFDPELPLRLNAELPITRALLYVVGVLAGGLLAWRNLKMGRGDLRGANKLAAFIVVVGFVDWLLGESHWATWTEEVASLYLWAVRGILTAVVGWLCYIAVEPHVRRLWPDILLAWNRILHGKFRDPLLGREVVIGGMCGILLVVLVQLDVLVPQWVGWPAPAPKLPNLMYDLGAVLGIRYKLSILVVAMMNSITTGLIVLLLMLLLRMLIRPAWAAMAVSWLLFTGLQALSADCDVFCPWLVSSVLAGVLIVLMTRVGFVAAIMGVASSSLLINSSLTSNLRAWYAPSGTVAVSLIVAILAYGAFVMRTAPQGPVGRLE